MGTSYKNKEFERSSELDNLAGVFKLDDFDKAIIKTVGKGVDKTFDITAEKLSNTETANKIANSKLAQKLEFFSVRALAEEITHNINSVDGKIRGIKNPIFRNAAKVGWRTTELSGIAATSPFLLGYVGFDFFKELFKKPEITPWQQLKGHFKDFGKWFVHRYITPIASFSDTTGYVTSEPTQATIERRIDKIKNIKSIEEATGLNLEIHELKNMCRSLQSQDNQLLQDVQEYRKTKSERVEKKESEKPKPLTQQEKERVQERREMGYRANSKGREHRYIKENLSQKERLALLKKRNKEHSENLAKEWEDPDMVVKYDRTVFSKPKQRTLKEQYNDLERLTPNGIKLDRKLKLKPDGNSEYYSKLRK